MEFGNGRRGMIRLCQSYWHWVSLTRPLFFEGKLDFVSQRILDRHESGNGRCGERLIILCKCYCRALTTLLDSAPNSLHVMKSKRMSSGIREWPEDERPRERLLARGPQDLTDGELIAILLRVGVRGKSAVELGHDLVKRFGSVQAMMNAPLAAWQGIKGLGMAKIAQLQAALELGRRAALPKKREETFIKNTQQAADYFKIRLRGLAEEHFRVAFLNRKGRLLDANADWIKYGVRDKIWGQES